MGSVSTRVSAEVFQAAQVAGREHGRSAAKQVAHWARLGRRLEESPDVTVAEVDRLLAGGVRYEELSDAARRIVQDRVDQRLSALSQRSERGDVHEPADGE